MSTDARAQKRDGLNVFWVNRANLNFLLIGLFPMTDSEVENTPVPAQVLLWLPNANTGPAKHKPSIIPPEGVARTDVWYEQCASTLLNPAGLLWECRHQTFSIAQMQSWLLFDSSVCGLNLSTSEVGWQLRRALQIPLFAPAWNVHNIFLFCGYDFAAEQHWGQHGMCFFLRGRSPVKFCYMEVKTASQKGNAIVFLSI